MSNIAASPDPAPVKKRAPTLYAIIAVKLVKGLALLALGLGVYSLSDNNLPEEFRALLRFFHVDPEKRFFVDLTTWLSQATPNSVLWVAGATVFYSLFSLVEAVGLMLRISWAGWLAIGESVFFIPIEVYELLHRRSVTVVSILVINIVIAWYLFVNRHRLFRHHLHS